MAVTSNRESTGSSQYKKPYTPPTVNTNNKGYTQAKRQQIDDLKTEDRGNVVPNQSAPAPVVKPPTNPSATKQTTNPQTIKPTTTPVNTQTTKPTATPVQTSTPTQTVVEAIAQQPLQDVQPQAPAYTPVTDNSGLINTQYSNLINALKAKIQQSINNKAMQMAQLPQKYQPIKNQNDLAAANSLRTVLEQNANAGDRGGIGRQNALNVDTARGSNLNAINLQQQNEMSSLQNDISNMSLEEAIQSGQLGSQQIADLIANNQYMDTQNYGRQQDQFRNNLSLADMLGTYNGQRTLQGQQFDANQQQQAWENQFRQGQFNYQVEQDKINREYQQRRNAIEDAVRNRQLSQDDARLALSQSQFDYQKQKDALDKVGNTTNYETNSDFQSDYAYAVQNGLDAEEEIKSKASELIAKYGVEGYNKLLQAARNA